MADEKKTAARTTYTILRRTGSRATGPNDAGGKDTFEVIKQDVAASSSDAAIRAIAITDPSTAGSYIAVPSRSFIEKTVKVETRKQVTLG